MSSSSGPFARPFLTSGFLRAHSRRDRCIPPPPPSTFVFPIPSRERATDDTYLEHVSCDLCRDDDRPRNTGTGQGRLRTDMAAGAQRSARARGPGISQRRRLSSLWRGPALAAGGARRCPRTARLFSTLADAPESAPHVLHVYGGRLVGKL